MEIPGKGGGRIMKNVALIAGVFAGLATASPIAVGIGAFGGGATVINFNALSDDTLITTQFVGLGLTVSGGLYADTTNSGFIIGSPSASNFVPTSPGPGPYNTIILTFTTPIIRIGMNEISNPGSFNIATLGGTLSYSSSLAPPGAFAGYQDLSGFTSVTLTVTGASNNAFGIDNLRFDTAVPEPSAGLLLAGALFMLFCARLLARPTTTS